MKKTQRKHVFCVFSNGLNRKFPHIDTVVTDQRLGRSVFVCIWCVCVQLCPHKHELVNNNNHRQFS